MNLEAYEAALNGELIPGLTLLAVGGITYLIRLVYVLWAPTQTREDWK